MMTQARLPAFTMKKLYGEDAMEDFEEMFEEASKMGAAFIIVEDIDRTFASKVMDKDTAKNAVPMSVFLNCLDGLAETDGIVAVATANNPKVLDPAILHRPGRFDRVISFPNPDAALRQRYFQRLMSNCVDCCLDKLVTRCEGMSFAQCREIYILAAQLANDSGRTIQESDLQGACERMEKHIKQMGGKDPGFK
jgi:ATP-dependent 26S proteasome regulatory subunit